MHTLTLQAAEPVFVAIDTGESNCRILFGRDLYLTGQDAADLGSRPRAASRRGNAALVQLLTDLAQRDRSAGSNFSDNRVQISRPQNCEPGPGCSSSLRPVSRFRRFAGVPNLLPRALAAASASRVRLLIRPASSSATAAIRCNINFPVGPSI